MDSVLDTRESGGADADGVAQPPAVQPGQELMRPAAGISSGQHLAAARDRQLGQGQLHSFDVL